mgnify:FL=1
MTNKFPSVSAVSILANALRERRVSRGETLVFVEKKTGVNRGQISRFESGQFKYSSKNLQILCKYMGVDECGEDVEFQLGDRFERFASSSPQNLSLAQELISFLERLGKENSV